MIKLIYLIHFEITGYQCNAIGSQRCDLFTNRTIFRSKSHLFLSQWEWDSKTKQPIRFQGFFKLTNHIAGKWKPKIHCLKNLAIKLCDFEMDLIKFQLNFGSCNFCLKSYLWIHIKLALRARSILKSRVWFQPKLHSTQSITIKINHVNIDKYNNY